MILFVTQLAQASFQINQLERADENLMRSINCYKNDDTEKMDDDIPLSDEELKEFELVLQYKTIRTKNVEDVLIWLLKKQKSPLMI